MKIRSLLLGLALIGAVATASAQNIVIVNGVKYAIHEVVKGETLYSLSKRYGVTIEEITNANKVLSEGLKVGQRIKIPAKGIEANVQEGQTVTSGITHKVAKRETLYSLSKRYGVSVEDICKANPTVARGLKAGQVIVIPSQPSESEPSKQEVAPEPTPVQVAEVAQVAETTQATEVATVAVPQTETPQVQSDQYGIASAFEQILSDIRLRSEMQFRTLAPTSRAEVALLLPFGSEIKPSQNYLDFYRGFLIGLDSVRMSGRSVNLSVFNTAHNHGRIEAIVNSDALHQADLIVGPIYEDELLPVVSALQQRGVPIVSPLANLTHTSSTSVFQMSPSPATKYDKVRNLFDGSKRVLIISADGIDKDFDAEVRSMLKEGTNVVEHKYVYEHPSVIEKRAEEREANGTFSPSDMTPLLRGSDPTVIVITANNEVDVDRILTAIASANISLSARSQRVVPFVVFGNNRWNRYRNIDKSLYFTNNVTMLSTYHARRSDAKIRNFDKRFVEEFSTLPSLYAYRGYDAAVLFVSALYGGLDVGLEGVLSMPLLTPYTFEMDGATGVRKNNQWVKVNYNSDFTITTE